VNNRIFKDSLYEKRYISDLKDMIDSCARLYGGKTAFFVKDRPRGEYRPITFTQFWIDINALGTSFLEMGLKGKKIAVIGENSYEWVVTYFAATNGTGVIVPIDRELKAKEIANLMNRAKVDAVVHSPKMEKVMKEVLPMVKTVKHAVEMHTYSDNDDGKEMSVSKLIERGKASIDAGNLDFVNAEIDREAMCTLMFTSGTTGLAKGVMLSHKNLSANVYNMSKYVDVTDYIGLSVLPMHHSYEMTCHIFTGLYQGFAVAICEGLRYIQPNMKEIHATVMLGVPLIFESIYKRIWKTAEEAGRAEKMRKMINISRKLKLYNNLPLMRRIFKPVHDNLGNNILQWIVGGAAMNPKMIEDFEAMGIPMIQGYGMSENAPIIAVNRDRYSKAKSVGQAMPGTEIKIIDKDENGMGEIICRGPSVMIGYYDDPELTAEVLKDGWLYTGDYGYMDDDGFLYISGRKKNVIVTKNGKNIFPEEVEFYLSENDYIEEALVHGIEDERTGDTVVKAEIFPNYDLIASEKGDLNEDELRHFLKTVIDDVNDQMPPYKHVKRFGIRKEEFSKTTTRKIKRHTSDNMDNGNEEDA